MPILHVRNVPEDLYKRIQERARREHRSLSAEVIMLLQQALQQPQRSQSEVLSDIRRHRFFCSAEVGAPDSVELLREDRER